VLLIILLGYHQVFPRNVLIDYVQRLYKIKYYVRYIGNEYTDLQYIVDDIRERHRTFYSTFDIAVIGRTDRGDILVPIPDQAEYYTLYKMTYLPEDNPHHTNTVIKIGNMRTYIAIDKKRVSYTTDVSPCPREYCYIENVPMWIVSTSPSCSSSLFFNDRPKIARLCHYEVTEKSTLPVISHVENKLKIHSLFNETLELLCRGKTKSIDVRERQTLVIKLKPECSVISKRFIFNFPNVMSTLQRRVQRPSIHNATDAATTDDTKVMATGALYTGVFSYVPSIASIIAIIYVLIKIKQNQLNLPRLMEIIAAQELLPIRGNAREITDKNNSETIKEEICTE